MKESVTITICMGSACFARGNAHNLERIEKYLKEFGMTANIELVGSRCENQCASGPNIIVNGRMYHAVDEKRLEEILLTLSPMNNG